ncbi:MAG TPA: DUF58 domain-containing protein, partial [Thermoanaerobaculia bacterium]|nr:DUF58 domain-containing protein [Thermoanaerobaculia bacterium]
MAKSRHAAPEAIRITKVGSWYVLFTVLVAIAATNTGNNALYMVWAVMLAVLVVSGVVSRQNLRSLEVELAPPGEVFANQPTGVAFTLRNRGRFWPRWFLLVSLARTSRPWLVPHLPVAGVGKGEFEVSFPRRGLETLKAVHVSTLFPFGLFKKGARYPLELELLVFPELFPASSVEPEATGENGQQSRRERGRGPDLHLLRDFQPGDDPRGIHWKQTARTGQTIFLEREAE